MDPHALIVQVAVVAAWSELVERVPTQYKQEPRTGSEGTRRLICPASVSDAHRFLWVEQLFCNWKGKLLSGKRLCRRLSKDGGNI